MTNLYETPELSFDHDNDSDVVTFGHTVRSPRKPEKRENTANLSKYELDDLDEYFDLSKPSNDETESETTALIINPALWSQKDYISYQTNTTFFYEPAELSWQQFFSQPWEHQSNELTEEYLLKKGYIKISEIGKKLSATLLVFTLMSLIFSFLSGVHMIYPDLAVVLTITAIMFYFMFKVFDESE